MKRFMRRLKGSSIIEFLENLEIIYTLGFFVEKAGALKAFLTPHVVFWIFAFTLQAYFI